MTLTREQIEELRSDLSAMLPTTEEGMEQYDALCDLAISALSHRATEQGAEDAKAFAMVKKLFLDIAATVDGSEWTVSGGDDTAWSGPFAIVTDKDLNRAIVTCAEAIEQQREPRGGKT